MSTLNELKDLENIKRVMYDETQKNLNEGIAKLNKAKESFNDFYDIYTILFSEIKEQEINIESMTKEVTDLRNAIKEKDKYISSFETRDKVYQNFEIEAVKVAKLLEQYQDKYLELEEREETFEKEKQKINNEKEDLQKEVEEQKIKVNNLNQQYSDARKSIDVAMGEKRSLEEEIKNLNNILGNKEKDIENKNQEIKTCKNQLEEKKREIEDLKNQQEDKINKIKGDENNKINELQGQIQQVEQKEEKEIEKLKEQIKEKEKKIEWYKNYAIGVDEKIIHYFEGQKGDLESHNKYLNDPSQWENHREHFPDFKKTDNQVSQHDAKEDKETNSEQFKKPEGENFCKDDSVVSKVPNTGEERTV